MASARGDLMTWLCQWDTMGYPETWAETWAESWDDFISYASYTMVIPGYPWSLALSLGSFGAPAPLKGLGMLHGGCQWCHGVSTIKEPRHTEARTELQKTRWTLDVFWIAT